MDMRILTATLFFIFSQYALAIEEMSPLPCAYRYDDVLITTAVPAFIGECSVGIAGGVVGLAVGIPVGVIAFPFVRNTRDTMIWTLRPAFGGSMVGRYLGTVVVGGPFWAAEQLLYRIPKKALTKPEAENPAEDGEDN